MNKNVILSIGSNLGDRKANIQKAIELVATSEVLFDIKKSSYYETEPFGFESRNWFVNVTIIAKTKLEYTELLFMCKSIEYMMGRRWQMNISDRVIDIDILFYDNISIKSKFIEIPHPRLHQRKFNLIPTIEVLPNFMHPVLNKTLESLLGECSDSSVVIKQ